MLNDLSHYFFTFYSLLHLFSLNFRLLTSVSQTEPQLITRESRLSLSCFDVWHLSGREFYPTMLAAGITVWRVRIRMFNSVFLFVKTGWSISSELLKSTLLLLIHCCRIMIILFAIPLTLTIESLLVVAETILFLFVCVKRAESNYSCCFKIICCRLQALLFYFMGFTGSLL